MIHCTSLSVHCGQNNSVMGGGVIEDGRFVTPHLQPNEKTQSLPGFYKRPSSPTSSKRKFHPYLKEAEKFPSKYTPDPNAKFKSEESISPRTDAADSKKSRRFLGGLFKRRKKETNSCSSSSEGDVEKSMQLNSKKSKKKVPSILDASKKLENKNEVTCNTNVFSPSCKSNYVIQTVSGRVINTCPSGSLGREIPNHQILGIPPLTMATQQSYLGRPGVSLSHDSLTPSAVSWNSESAYGSINSSMRSSRLGRSSSNDTLNRKGRREALKARVEKLRERVRESSSDDDVGSTISSHFGSENSLSRSDSMNSRSRGSRTERYIRRKSHELETLKVETEKDKRTREVVQARILEIQKSKKLKGAQSELNMIAHRLPSPQNNAHNSSFSLSTEPYSPLLKNFPNSYFSHAHRSVSYDSNINHRSFQQSSNRSPVYMNSVGVVPPAPPPRDRSRVVSPQDMHRPISYSFESLSKDPSHLALNTNGLPMPYRGSFHKSGFQRNTPCCSSLPLRDSLPPTTPFRRSFSEKHSLADQIQPSRPLPPKVYIPSEAIVNQTDISRPVNCDTKVSKNIPITSMPPSPSSDYSSYISDNSSRMSHCQTLIPENDTKQVPILMNSLPVLCTTNESCKEASPWPPESDSSGGSKQEKYSSVDKTSPLSNRKVPDPPKRNSSSLSRMTSDYLRKHLDLLNSLEQSEPKNQEELHKKMEEAFIKEKERLEKSKCANFEEALKELESIYQSLDLNSEDIIDGAEKRDSGDMIDTNLRRKAFPDKTFDDLHVRRVQLNNRIIARRKKLPENTGSYMLVSPIHVPPHTPEQENQTKGNKKEPDVISDDVTFRNVQRANALKVIDPQPPFGIPIGPTTQCSNSDYLHSSPTPDLEPIVKNEPNVVTDDLAFRALRKDLKSGSNKSLNTSELDDILSEANESPNVNRRSLRSSSADRMSTSFSNSAHTARKADLQTPRKVKQQQKAKRGGKFFDSFKDALTDTEGGASLYPWKQSASWVERAHLGYETSTETLTDISSIKAQSQPDIRHAIIKESRNADGGPEDPFAFLVEPDKILPRSESPPVLVKVQAVTESTVTAAKPYKQLDVIYNNKPKPFYLTKDNKECLPQQISPVDIAKLDDLISSISGVEKQQRSANTRHQPLIKEADIFNEGLEAANLNIEKAILTSLSSSNSEVRR